MEPQTFYILLVVLVGGFLGGILVALLPLINQIKKTARQVEATAAGLDAILQHEFKALLTRGEKVLEGLGEIQPLVKDKLTHIPDGAPWMAFLGLSNHIARFLMFWTLKEIWRRIKRKKRS